MDIASLQPSIWVNTDQLLQSAFDELEHEPRISVDTESNSLFAYQEKICLIQISSPNIDYIFDPFVLKNLSLLGNLFQNPSQEKIFHASEYDIICLKRDYDFKFANIFDTMIAARILGYNQIGLGSLLSQHYDITLDKKYQRANWGQRPLPTEMLDYARLDTHYLFQLRDTLEFELISHELIDLAQEDFANACQVKAHHSSNNHSECWKVAGSNHIDARQAAVLQELCKYRDDQARKADLPHFKVLSNEVLLELSRLKPASFEDLKTIPHCTTRIINRHGSGLLQAIARGDNSQPVIRQKNVKPDESYLARIDCLKEWRKKKAKELKVESDIVLPREMVEKIASTNPSDIDQLATIMIESPVRYRKFGKMILEAIEKEANS